MKKGFGKLLSLVIAVLMLASIFSVSAFAFSNDYVTVECPENFDEEVWSGEEGFYVNLWYEEWYTAEDGNEYYTGNTVDLYMEACWDDTVKDYYDESTLDYLEDYLEGKVDSIDSKSFTYANIGGYDAVVYDMYYTYTGETVSGQRETAKGLYSEVIVVTHECCVTLDIDVMFAEDLVVCRNQLAESFLNSITYNDEAIQQAEADEKNLLIIVFAVLGGVVLVSIIVPVIIIVVVVNSSKKKKAQRAAQQYNPYGYNPNMQYNPYGQYNSNGQAPVNNGQYNPYGQQPPVNNNQYNTYNPQNNTYVPYTPVQPATSETKDPLDLDNKE